MRHLEHGPGHVDEDTGASLRSFNHPEWIAREHRSAFLRCLIGKEILQSLDAGNTEFLQVPADHGVVENVLGTVLKHLAHKAPETLGVAVGNQPDDTRRYFAGVFDVCNGISDLLIPFVLGLFILLFQQLTLLLVFNLIHDRLRFFQAKGGAKRLTEDVFLVLNHHREALAEAVFEKITVFALAAGGHTAIEGAYLIGRCATRDRQIINTA